MPHKGRFEYKKLAKYPHLDREDIITWEQFINENPTAYNSVDYDFALGENKKATEMAQELGIPGAERVYKYRADVVGYRNNEIHIIELKKRATPAVIGQVLADVALWVRDYGNTPPVKAVVIARDATPEMDFLAASHNVFLIEV
ncbi:MAG: hypothetical protein ACE5HI_07365 [bacterium]